MTVVVLTPRTLRVVETTRPLGVHVLSAESRAALARAKAKSAAIAARHTKSARLAAAIIKTMDPER